MNCRRAKKRILEASGNGVSEPLTRHLEDCADCRRFFEMRRWVRDALQAAREEWAGPGFESRLLDAVRAAATRTPEREPVFRRILQPEWILPVWRFAAAASLAAALGVWIVRSGDFPDAVSSRHAHSAQVLSPALPLQSFLPASAVPDPSPPLAAAGSFWMDRTNRPGSTSLRFVGFEP